MKEGKNWMKGVSPTKVDGNRTNDMGFGFIRLQPPYYMHIATPCFFIIFAWVWQTEISHWARIIFCVCCSRVWCCAHALLSGAVCVTWPYLWRSGGLPQRAWWILPSVESRLVYFIKRLFRPILLAHCNCIQARRYDLEKCVISNTSPQNDPKCH